MTPSTLRFVGDRCQSWRLLCVIGSTLLPSVQGLGDIFPLVDHGACEEVMGVAIFHRFGQRRLLYERM